MHLGQEAHHAGAYPGFLSIKHQGVNVIPCFNSILMKSSHCDCKTMSDTCMCTNHGETYTV